MIYSRLTIFVNLYKEGIFMERVRCVVFSAFLIFLLVVTIGCSSFSRNKNEEIIKAVVEHQLYYNDSLASDVASSIILRSEAAVTPAYTPYFAGSVRYVSSKKLLYSNLKMGLLYLTSYGYLDYDVLKEICAKFANLQEKATYTITETENLDTTYRKRGYDAYSLTVDYPMIALISKKIVDGIYDDLKSEYNINMDTNAPLKENLEKLRYKTNDLSVLRKYGEIVRQNFLNVLDDPKFSVGIMTKVIYIKQTGKEIKDLDEYNMPDGDSGRNLVRLSNYIWNESKPYLGSGRNTYGSSESLDSKHFMMDFLNYPFGSSIRNDSAQMQKIEQLIITLRKDLNAVDDQKSLEAFLDKKEQIDEELIPLISDKLKQSEQNVTTNSELITDTRKNYKYPEQRNEGIYVWVGYMNGLGCYLDTSSIHVFDNTSEYKDWEQVVRLYEEDKFVKSVVQNFHWDPQNGACVGGRGISRITDKNLMYQFKTGWRHAFGTEYR